jgi:ferredoxin-NADP reductase
MMSQNTDQSHITLRVRRRAEIAVNALLLELESASGEVLPEWPPGAHLDIHLPSGLTRQYSLCGAREDRSTYVVVVLREPHGRGGSEEIYRELGVGTEFISSTPRDHFRLVDASEYVLIAGGIGITPIKAMVDELRARGARWRLHYGGRSREHMAFVDELVDLGGDNVSIVPQDVDGLLDVPAIIGNLSPEAAIYCCGPAPLLDAVLTACAEAGASERLHFERFVPPTDGAGFVTDGDTAFEVELRSSGVTLQVPADKTLLEVVQSVLPDVPFSCTEGYCGSCESVVLDGEPDHRGSLMTPEEHDEERTMLICVGRSKSHRLVLDL